MQATRFPSSSLLGKALPVNTTHTCKKKDQIILCRKIKLKIHINSKSKWISAGVRGGPCNPSYWEARIEAAGSLVVYLGTVVMSSAYPQGMTRYN